MDPFTLLFASAVALVAFYYVIHGAVFSALRRHSLWQRDGSMEKEVIEARVQREKRRR